MPFVSQGQRRRKRLRVSTADYERISGWTTDVERINGYQSGCCRRSPVTPVIARSRYLLGPTGASSVLPLALLAPRFQSTADFRADTRMAADWGQGFRSPARSGCLARFSCPIRHADGFVTDLTVKWRPAKAVQGTVRTPKHKRPKGHGRANAMFPTRLATQILMRSMVLA